MYYEKEPLGQSHQIARLCADAYGADAGDDDVARQDNAVPVLLTGAS